VNLRIATLIVIIAWWGQAAQAGVVRTPTEVFEGKIAFEDGAVTIDGKKVPWEDVICVLADTGTVAPGGQRLWLKNGETWQCEALQFNGKVLTVRSSYFGKTDVGVDLLAGVEFARSTKTESADQLSKQGTLYRVKGDPVPGKLLRFDADQLSVDSPIGVLDLPREGMLRYVWSDKWTAFENEIDEVRLTDGAVYRGRIEPAGDILKLDHPVLGDIKVPTKLVRSLLRHKPEIKDLTELAPESVKSESLTSAESAGSFFWTIRGDGAESPRFVKGLRIEPKTVVRFKLPKTTAKSVVVRGQLLPMDGAEGDLRIRIRSGNEERLNKEIKAADKPSNFSVEIPVEDEFIEFQVEFGTRLRFPCGVVLADPQLILKP
jgi:hypothetical protein